MFQDGQRLGEFEILGRIGQGGMGAVYKARQVTLDRLVALKTLQGQFASDEEFIARFRREAKAAASLIHPNLVQVFSAGENEGLHWFAMEFVEGESAKARLTRKERLDPAEAIAIGIHIATALEYGWRKAQLIHRDIKPDNIFLSTDGEVKLGDLGLAKSAGETISLTMTGAAMGTPHYVSPEQGEGKKDVDLRADIYSLGCTLFHLVAGKPPYGGDTAMAVMLKHVTAPIPNPQEAWPGFPGELARVVVKMMAKNPTERQQTYAEVLADLRRAYDSLTSDTLPQVVAVTMQPQPAPPPKPASAVDPSAPTMIFPAPDAQPAPPPAAAAPDSKSETQNLKLRAAIIAVVVAVLGIVAWFAFGKKGPQLTEAERAEKARQSSPALQRAEPSATAGRPEGLKPATALPAASATFAPLPASIEARAIKLWDSPEKIPKDNGVSWENGALRLESVHKSSGPESRDAILRASVLANTLGGAVFMLRKGQDDLQCRLSVEVPRQNFALRTHVSSGVIGQWKFPRAYGPDEWMHIELRVIGDAFTVLVDGQILGTARSSELNRAGKASVFGGSGGGYFRDITYIPFDGLPEAELQKLAGVPAVSPTSAPQVSKSSPTPSAATKDAPFVNSLGMKFVPVPIGGGPTKGQRVLFGVWDTRAQDYAAYAAANPQADNSWTTKGKENVPAGREPEHPVVGVSWEDAQAFCQWLTAKETAEGKLPQGMKYRLPSDEEWSWAAGMPPESGATPEEKNGQNTVDFPWGRDWPPTKKVGNYADETFHGKFPKTLNDKTKDRSWMVGYDDGYATTSPVGSFPANAYGLYDMSGNVWQWCEDWWNAEHKDRVLRGASWNDLDRGALLSSYRPHVAPGYRNHGTGFRCVVGVSAR